MKFVECDRDDIGFCATRRNPGYAAAAVINFLDSDYPVAKCECGSVRESTNAQVAILSYAKRHNLCDQVSCMRRKNTVFLVRATDKN